MYLQLTVLYSTLYLYITAIYTTYDTDYILYKKKTKKKKKQKIKGAGKYGKILVKCSSNSKEKKKIKYIFPADSLKISFKYFEC